VKFLIDAQLPPALAQFLRDAGHEAKHVVEIGLERSDDSSIRNRAVSDGAVIVTKDEDFAARIQIDHELPPVVWLRIGNCSNHELLGCFSAALAHVLDCLRQGEKLIEIV
jgi:predicted nuclease of predicted toxin-antitoxin system